MRPAKVPGVLLKSPPTRQVAPPAKPAIAASMPGASAPPPEIAWKEKIHTSPIRTPTAGRETGAAAGQTSRTLAPAGRVFLVTTAVLTRCPLASHRWNTIVLGALLAAFLSVPPQSYMSMLVIAPPPPGTGNCCDTRCKARAGTPPASCRQIASGGTGELANMLATPVCHFTSVEWLAPCMFHVFTITGGLHPHEAGRGAR